MRPFRCLLAILLLPAPALAAVHVDGRMAPGEWEGARHVTDFRLTQPLSREPAPYPTDACWGMPSRKSAKSRPLPRGTTVPPDV